MYEWFVTASVLILAVLVLRQLLKKRVGAGLRYGLWLIVLIRLFFPFYPVESRFSVMNLAPDSRSIVLSVSENDNQSAGLRTLPGTVPEASQPAPDRVQSMQPELEGTSTPRKGKSVSLVQVLTWIWIGGMGIAGTALLFSNLHFSRRLRISRRRIEQFYVPLKVYMTPLVSDPCLFGLVSPAIYLPWREDEMEGMLPLILAHEYAHYRQGDHIWSALRCICLTVHWFNPLVWLGAKLSRQDGEIACDECAIGLLGETYRRDYGEMLIHMTNIRREPGSRLLAGVSMSSGGKGGLQERITMIVRHPKSARHIRLLVITASVLAALCTFTGAKTPVPPPDPDAVLRELIPSYRPINKHLRSGDFLRYGDEFLLGFSWNGSWDLMAFHPDSGTLRTFCSGSQCDHPAGMCQKMDISFPPETESGVTFSSSLEEGVYRCLINDDMILYSAYGNIYAQTQDGKLLVCESGGEVTDVLAEKLYPYPSEIADGYLYSYNAENEYVRINLRSGRFEVEPVLGAGCGMLLLDESHIYYAKYEWNGTYLYRCNLDGSQAALFWDEPITGCVEQDGDDLYFVPQDGAGDTIYRHSKTFPDAPEVVAKLSQSIGSITAIPGTNWLIVSAAPEEIRENVFDIPVRYLVSRDGSRISVLSLE